MNRSHPVIDPARALPGRHEPIFDVPQNHSVLPVPLLGPFDEGTELIYLGLGCFWGAEKLWWDVPGVVGTAVGYQGGFTPHPTYQEVCTGMTGHTETVMVAFDPVALPVRQVLRVFFEAHDPTQGFRQGNDVGSQYRSAIYYTSDEQFRLAAATMDAYAKQLSEARYGPITTEVRSTDDAGPFYPAEDYHQQYLHKVPDGYCPVHSTGVACRLPDGA